jgi:hypothetical protein
MIDASKIVVFVSHNRISIKKANPDCSEMVYFFLEMDCYINNPPIEAICPAKMNAMVLITLINEPINDLELSL